MPRHFGQQYLGQFEIETLLYKKTLAPGGKINNVQNLQATIFLAESIPDHLKGSRDIQGFALIYEAVNIFSNFTAAVLEGCRDISDKNI